MSFPVRVRLRAFALLAATVLGFTVVAGALANAPDAGSIQAGVSGTTATVSGTWSWRDVGKCDDRWVGWAIDWNDPNDPGNRVAQGVAVGTAADNTVHTNGDCGSAIDGKARSGSWGPLSHAYRSGGTYRICVVMYDIHVQGGDVDAGSPDDATSGGDGSDDTGKDKDKKPRDKPKDDGNNAPAGKSQNQAPAAPQPQPGDLVAGGNDRNRDNSVEKNHQGPESPGCATVTIALATTAQAAPSANLVVRKTVDQAAASPGDTLSYEITVENTGNADAQGVDVADNIEVLLVHGALIRVGNGGSLSGSVLSWPSAPLAAGASRAVTFQVKLDRGGWDSGTTELVNTAMVPNSNCAAGAATAACQVSTTVSPRFALSVTKGVAAGSSGPWAPSLTATASDTVWYRIKIANDGNATLTGVKVRDSLGIPAGQCEAPPATLAPGAGWTCVYARTLREGTVINTATADSAQTKSVSDVATVLAGPAAKPAIRISVGADPSQLPIGGGTASYAYTVTNPGNVALSSVSVTDNRCVQLTFQGGDANSNDRVDPDETWRYSCSGTLTATTTNTATAAGTFGSTRVTDSDRATVRVLVAEPGLHLEVTGSPTQLPVGGGTASYGYVVTNVGNAPLSSVAVTDDTCAPVVLVSGDANTNGKLDLSEEFHFACATSLATSTTNHAQATGSFGDQVVSDTDQATVSVAAGAPGINVVTGVNPAALPAGGGSVTWTAVVSNTGNQPLANVGVQDDRCEPVTFDGGDANSNSLLDLDETWQFSCTGTINATTTNLATASGSDGTTTVTDADPATAAVTASSAAISLVATVDPTTVPPAGGPVTYSYLVTNKGNVPLSDVTVVDDTCTSVTAIGGDANGDGRLDPSEAWAYTCVATITQTTTNMALATGFSNGQPVTDTDTALVTIGTAAVHTPRIGLTLNAEPLLLPDAGGDVVYTYAVSNKGDVALSNVTLSHDRCSPVSAPLGDANGDGLLDQTETWTYACTRKVTRTTAGTATVRGEADGQTVEATDTATITVAAAAPGPATPGTAGSAPPGAPSGGTTPSPTTGAAPQASAGTSPGSGAVAGVTSPPKASSGAAPTSVTINTGSTPSGISMILVLMIGIAAAVLIMTLSKRSSKL